MSCPLRSQVEVSPAVPAAEDAEFGAELQARLRACGARALDDAECLVLLCQLSELDARRLLSAFGSLPEVMGASIPDLARVGGEAAALRLKVAVELADRLLLRPLRARSVLSSWSAVLAHLRTVMVGAPREHFRGLFLDRRNRLIADEVLGEGTVDHAPVYPREVMRRALELHASALVVAHNHPSGDPTPSSADVDMTRQLAEAAKALGIGLHDHIVVAGQEAVSFRALGLL